MKKLVPFLLALLLCGCGGEEQERWNLESTAKSMMTRLGIYDFDEKTGHLSGGQKS